MGVVACTNFEKLDGMEIRISSAINSPEPVVLSIKETNIAWGVAEPILNSGNTFWCDEFSVFLVVGGTRKERRDRLMNYLPASNTTCYLKNNAGQPYLEDGPFFSLSHTGGYSILAISETYQLGIDIEIDRKIRFAKQIASRFFHPAERKLLERKDWTSPEFLKIWVLKEAIIKSRGQSFLRTCRMIDSGIFRVGYMRYRVDRDYLNIALHLAGYPDAKKSKLYAKN